MKGILSHHPNTSGNLRTANKGGLHRNLKPVAKSAVQLPAETAGMAIVDTQLRYVQIDEALARLNGLPVEAHIGKTVHEVLPQLASVVEPIDRKSTRLNSS